MDSEDNMHDLDSIHVVGTMTKEQKNNYISKFLSKNDNPHFNIKVFCATSGVGNAGIDPPNVCVVCCIDISPSLLDTTKNKGGARRLEEASPNDNKYIMCFSFETYIQVRAA